MVYRNLIGGTTTSPRPSRLVLHFIHILPVLMATLSSTAFSVRLLTITRSSYLFPPGLLAASASEWKRRRLVTTSVAAVCLVSAIPCKSPKCFSAALSSRSCRTLTRCNDLLLHNSSTTFSNLLCTQRTLGSALYEVPKKWGGLQIGLPRIPQILYGNRICRSTVGGTSTIKFYLRIRLLYYELRIA